jgi:hypothetical protein
MRTGVFGLIFGYVITGSSSAYAQHAAERAHNVRYLHRNAPPRAVVRSASPALDPSLRASVPSDLDQRRRDGHMTPEERHLLRQHIEDAVRELYKR